MTMLTEDERRIVWDQHPRLALPSLAARPDWTIDVLRDTHTYGGDYRIARRADRTGMHIEWRDWTVHYSPNQSCRRCRGPHLGQWTGLCAPDTRGHLAGVGPITDRTHTATLRWARLHKWVLGLTDQQRARLASHGTAATAQDLHWTLHALIGPPPVPLFRDQPALLVGDQYALFGAA